MPKIKILKNHSDAQIPYYATEGSACFDVTIVESVDLLPGQIYPIRTGLKFEIPIGYEMQVRQRSGLSKYYPNYIANAPGTIDSDYRGELFILTVNNTDITMHIDAGIRFAQCKIQKVERLKIVEVDELSDTERGSGAFGSTGLRSE
jgi:dUTP pyrophosphatase